MTQHNKRKGLFGQASAVAIGVVLSSAWAAHAHAAEAQTDQADNTVRLDEIIVTARKREESLRDAPLSIQALGERQIERLNLTRFEDYARFAPSVSFVSQGPGQTKIVIRGVAEGPGDDGQAISALYLDEQPITSDQGMNPDPRLVDVQRIEVLSGPQGTLYGASSQSGAIRVITNKPDASRYEGQVEATASSTRHGDPSYDLNGVINLPIIRDRLALRVVGYASEDGGFIDNVLGATPAGERDNADVVGENVNSARTYGGRIAAQLDLTEGWDISATHVFQDVDVEGRSDYDPAVGDLQTVRFFDESFNDEWAQSAVTLRGDLGFADLVLTGAYFTRKTAYLNDNTAYNQYLASTAYAFPLYDFGADPIGYNRQVTDSDRTTLEGRLSSKGGSRWNWIVGAFYEKSDYQYDFSGAVVDFADTPGFAAALALQPDLAPTDVYFFQINRIEREQYALFGELTWSVTDRLDLTVGGRWFDAETDGALITRLPLGASAPAYDDDGLPVITWEESLMPASEDGFTPKLNISYRPTDDLMLFATYSQGFRLGGANRQRQGLAVPVQYEADILTNYEAGVKTTWLDGALTLDAVAFLMTWDDFQASILNPDPSTFFYVTANVGQAEIRGVELQGQWRPVEGLTLGGALTLLNAELTEASPLMAGGVPEGARLPVSPEVKFALNGEYLVPVPQFNGDAYFRFDYSYTGDSVNNINPADADVQDAYQIVNLQTGFEAQSWSVNLFVNNLFDERAQLYVNQSYYSELRITPNRPRQIGLTVSRRF